MSTMPNEQPQGPPKGRVIMAPSPFSGLPHHPSVFLSGSIDAAPPAANWQSLLSHRLSTSHPSLTILNPYRPDWDSSWREDISDSRFCAQVNWELDALEAADVIAVYCGGATDAPITLLEMGLFARRKKMVVACHRAYRKRGNVQVVCRRLGVKVVESVEELAQEVGVLVTEWEEEFRTGG